MTISAGIVRRLIGVICCLSCGSLSCRKTDSLPMTPNGHSASGETQVQRPAGSVPVNADRERPVSSSTSDSSAVSTVHLTPIVRPRQRVDELSEKQDATRDDWTSEVLTDTLLANLADLAQRIEAAAPAADSEPPEWLAADFSHTVLCPRQLEQVPTTPELRVARWQPGDDSASAPSETRGAPAFTEALFELRGIVAEGGQRRVKLKLIRINVGQSSIETEVLYEAWGRDAQERRQQTARWQCHWLPATDRSPPRLQSIRLKSFETVTQAAESAPLFQDETVTILSGNPSYHQQMVPSIHHWLRRVTREFLGQFGHHGLAVGDVNGDGRDDLYVCDAGGLPNRLYIQQPDGSARDVSAAAGVDILDDSTGALLADLDNDGDQDLVVVAESSLNVAENLGNTKYRWRVQSSTESGLMSVTAADFDNDGDLDLYACGYYPTQQGPSNRDLPFPWPYQDANNGGRNVLLRNEGNWNFHDATEQVGLDANNRRFSFAAAWDDYDNDGDVDLYVANDFGRNCLYRNDEGYFHDVAAALQVEDQASGMSVSWGDYNRDGWMDLYVGNMFSAAGNRITHQSRFATGLAADTVSLLQRMARGNSMFANDSGESFRDTTLDTETFLGRWSWASRLTDINNDGWQDILIANGYLTNEQPDDL